MKKLLFTYILFTFLFPCEPGYESFMEQCYFSSDVDILREILDYSMETVNMDMDNPSWFSESGLGNGNGIIEPFEICSDEWSNGRLVTVVCGCA